MGNSSATSGRHAKLWNISYRTEVATFQHDKWVWTVDLSSDGRYLATDDGVGTTVKVWDIQRKQITRDLRGAYLRYELR